MNESANKTTLQPTERDYTVWIAGILIGIGCLLRIVRYVQGRSLWLDEVLLAKNIQSRGFLELLKPLDYRQGAPVLFLWLEKLATLMFGPSEWALRSVSLIAGLISLPLLWLVSKRLIGNRAALIALALFAFIEPAIYYSSEVKQYGSDLMCTLLVLLALLRADEKTSIERWMTLLIVGVIAILLSHPTVFVLGGAGSVLLVNYFLLRDRDRASRLGIVASVWMSCFAANYFLFLRHLVQEPGLQHHWADGFIPLSIHAPSWLARAYLRLFDGYETMWLRFAWPALVVSLLGWMTFRRRDRLLLLLPICFTLLASAIHAYAFEGRLVYFLVPLVAIPVGTGVDYLWRIRRGYLCAIPIALAALIIVPAAGRAAMFLVHPPGREEIQPVLAHLSSQVQPDDKIYVYHGANAAYLYYRDRYGLHDHPIIEGNRTDEIPDALVHDVSAMHGRVWMVFSHVWDDEDRQLLKLLDKRGRRMDEFRATGASTGLYVLP